MNLIGEDYKALPNDERIIKKHFWMFYIKEKDFYLKRMRAWHHIETDAYRLKIGKNTVDIPTNYYVMIGSVYGDLDWIKVDELIARDFEVFLMSNDLEMGTWMIEDVSVVSYVETEIMYPKAKNPIPIMVGDNYSMLVSPIDLYNKMSGYSFVDIIG